MSPARRLLVALGLILAASAVFWPAARPRLTLYDMGLRLDYSVAALLGPLLAALGCAALAAAAPRGGWRLALLLLVPLLLAPGVERLAWRLEADASGIGQRRLLGAARLAWPEVTAVRPGRELVLERRAGQPLRVPLAALTPEQRAALERTISRRVAAAGTPR